MPDFLVTVLQSAIVGVAAYFGCWYFWRGIKRAVVESGGYWGDDLGDPDDGLGYDRCPGCGDVDCWSDCFHDPDNPDCKCSDCIFHADKRTVNLTAVQYRDDDGNWGPLRAV